MNALARLDDEKRELLARTLCAGSSRDELDLFFSICERTGLDPFARQIYAVKRWDGRQRREVMQTQVSIDGARLTAQRSGEYRGQDGPFWCGTDGRWTDVWLSSDPPAAARVGVMRAGFTQPLYGVALFSEYAQRNKEGGLTAMWAKMPAVMIAKCAEMLALRKAFPSELSGLYSAEEMGQAKPAETEVEHVPAPVPPMPPLEAQKPAALPAPAEEPAKPARKRKAAAAEETPVAKPADTYPEEYEGLFRIHGVVRRSGRAHAIDATGEFGRLWIATTVEEYAKLCEDAKDGDLTLDLARVGAAMTIMRVVRQRTEEANDE